MSTRHRAEDKFIVMLGIDPASKLKGGISAVIDVYRANGWFARWPIFYIGTMISGTNLDKLRIYCAALWKFLRLVMAERVVLVHAHTASRASFWRKSTFMLIAHAANVPVILHLHGGAFEEFYRRECGPLRQRYIRFVLRSVDRVVVLSSQWRARIASIEPKAKTMTIVNPVNVPSIVPTGAERAQADLLFLGRFGQQKGIFDLLEACAIVRKTFPALRLRCGGDGDAASVEARAHELGLSDCVTMLGWVSGQAKDRELQQATVYVLPSYIEGLPMGVLEAMATGTPTIATRVGGIPDAIDDGVTGFLIEPGDVDALADRITQLLADQALRERFASEARARVVSTFSPQRVLARLEDLYRRLGAQPRPLRITPANTTATTGESLDLSVGDR
jgi:glycosyltransferase involved in cell wall biosynthesis